MVKLLLARGAKVNEIEGGGNTAFFWAAFYGNSEILRTLLSYNADPELKSSGGKSPLQIAQERNHREVVLLIGAEIAKRNGSNLNP